MHLCIGYDPTVCQSFSINFLVPSLDPLDNPSYDRMRENIHFQEAPFCAAGKSHLCDGQGLFALKAFRRGEMVASYSETSPLRASYPFDEIPPAALATSWWIGKTTAVAEVFPPESLFMRANHSRDPNCFWDTAQQTLTALREILPGEEITYDYRLEIAPPSIKANPPAWA